MKMFRVLVGVIKLFSFPKTENPDHIINLAIYRWMLAIHGFEQYLRIVPNPDTHETNR